MVAWLALGAALVALLHGVAARLRLSMLLSPGLLIPLGLLALAVAAVVVLRRAYTRSEIHLEGPELQVRPGWLTRLVKGTAPRTLRLPDAQAIRLLATGDGARLAFFGEEGSPPLLVTLARIDVAAFLEAADRAPGNVWESRARIASEELRARGERVLLQGAAHPPHASGPELAATCRAAGLWQLAADALWPTVLSHPGTLKHALDLHAGERHRLPTVSCLALLQALVALHPHSPTLLLDYARLCVVLRNRPEAQATLDRLVMLPDPPAVGVRWRQVLREKRRVPAPPSKATFGIEVALPSHRIEGDELVVDDRWRVGLHWFVAYRLLPGFWGLPRRLQLIDVWGASHMVMGDPLDWAARLERCAPHLREVHDEGLLWPGTAARIRQLRRRGRGLGGDPDAEPDHAPKKAGG